MAEELFRRVDELNQLILNIKEETNLELSKLKEDYELAKSKLNESKKTSISRLTQQLQEVEAIPINCKCGGRYSIKNSEIHKRSHKHIYYHLILSKKSLNDKGDEKEDSAKEDISAENEKDS